MKTKLKVLISKPDGELLDSFWVVAHSDKDIRNVISDQLNVFDDEAEIDYCLHHEGIILDALEEDFETYKAKF
jgi:hypothetical protein